MNGTAVVHDTFSGRQKAAHISFLLWHGNNYDVSQVADMFSMSTRGARNMLNRVSGVIPLVDETVGNAGQGYSQPPRMFSRWKRFDYD